MGRGLIILIVSVAECSHTISILLGAESAWLELTYVSLTIFEETRMSHIRLG